MNPDKNNQEKYKETDQNLEYTENQRTEEEKEELQREILHGEVPVEEELPSPEEEKDSSPVGEEKPAEEESSSKKKGFFHKKPSKEEKLLEEKTKEVENLTDRLMRTMAEFDNFRKRSEKEKQGMFDMGSSAVLEKLLGITDNFERGFDTIEEADREDAFVQGMDMVYKQLLKMLDDLQVKEIPALGETFDPNLHNAVMHIEDEEHGEKEIVQVFQKGYTYKGKVLRYSMVQVAN